MRLRERPAALSLPSALFVLLDAVGDDAVALPTGGGDDRTLVAKANFLGQQIGRRSPSSTPWSARSTLVPSRGCSIAPST